jgi:hypothetical protein
MAIQLTDVEFISLLSERNKEIDLLSLEVGKPCRDRPEGLKRPKKNVYADD